MDIKYIIAGCLFWGPFLLSLIMIRPSGAWSQLTIGAAEEGHGKAHRIATFAAVAGVIILSCFSMSLSPSYNGTNPMHRNQYEVLAESFLEGRLDLDYGDTDPMLQALDNPYDPVERREAGVSFHWDHAYYNGKYYMYFGVVPVVLLFLPFRALTGVSLTTYHATQIFTGLFIIGVFSMFINLAKRFFLCIPYSTFLLLAVAVSLMSTWYIDTVPALYCTAIAAAICVEIWSLYLFMRAAWSSGTRRRTNMDWTFGALLGALTFGCRPTVALANVLVIPLFISWVRDRSTSKRSVLQASVGLVVPYVVVGMLLMIYNYARFDSFTEFGQSYQLTDSDQSNYGDFSTRINGSLVLNGILQSFAEYKTGSSTFPYVDFQGALLNFPITIVAIGCAIQSTVLDSFKKNRILGFMIILALVPILITVFQVAWSPWLLERYRSDFYWLIGIFTYISFGFFLIKRTEQARSRWAYFFSILALVTVLQSFLLWSVPKPYTDNYAFLFPNYLKECEKILTFGISSGS